MKALSFETGERFGRLRVCERLYTGDSFSARRASRWLLLCDCGMFTVVQGAPLKSGFTISCGCARRPHGDAGGTKRHPLYATWQSMRQRCEQPNHHNYNNYGARGIRVTAEFHDWVTFRDWITQNLGPRPKGYSLDRIDNDGNYEPGNLRWATTEMQNKNKHRKRHCSTCTCTTTHIGQRLSRGKPKGH